MPSAPTDTSASKQPATPGTRDRLIAAMLDALRRRGFHGVGLNELLAQADAPKGVLYHHFPGGKSELAVAAVQQALSVMLTSLDRMLKTRGDPVQALAAWMQGAQKVLLSSGFEQGCPLATIALESTPQDTAIRAALADGFAAIRQRLADALAAHGMNEATAPAMAALIVSAYEGALLQARVAGRADALHDTCTALIEVIRPQLRADAGVQPFVKE